METNEKYPSPFVLEPPAEASWPKRAAARVAFPLLYRFWRFGLCDGLYAEAARASHTTDTFLDQILKQLQIDTDVSEPELDKIPAQGPTIVVANHPFGGLEGLLLAQAIRRRHSGGRVMANQLLNRVEVLRDIFILVDPFETETSKAANLKGMRQAIRHLKGGGVLGVFPSGTVSHYDPKQRCVTDPPWTDMLARLIRRTEASVVPAYFGGRNGKLFQLAGMIHPRLRTLMIPREMTAHMGQTVPMRIGNVIPFSKLDTFEDDEDLTEYLRMRTYMLADQPDRKGKRKWIPLPRKKAPPAIKHAPVAPAVDPMVLADEIASLAPSAKLDTSGDLSVYVARARRVPHVIQELGRLREITFRAADEGTGQPTDLDRFDYYYLHLFVWNEAKKEIVGAYRLGPSDVILRRYGKRGFYTHTLFRYRSKLIKDINPALELGRSFVRPEYQRSYSSLLMLWKGIGAFVVRHPRYRHLVGPVSINDEYKDLSQWMIMAFLRAHTYLPALAKLTKPKNPPKLRPPRNWDDIAVADFVDDIDDVNSLISEIETDQKGVPILIKQYLKLGARLLAFNVDPAFGQCLDGLMVCDLVQADRRILKHYMGKEGSKSFFDYHARHNTKSPADTPAPAEVG